jgi:hypothetical protein
VARLSQTDLSLTIRVVELSPKTFIAVTRLGGFTLRGERSADAFDAVRSLFTGLAGKPDVSSHIDAGIALDLALAGTSIENVAAAAEGLDESKTLGAGDVEGADEPPAV